LDFRDNPLGAHEGLLLSATVEHVHAEPVGEDTGERCCSRETASVLGQAGTSVFDPVTSDFFRYDGQAATYLPFGRHLALVVSVSGGFIQHRTRQYPNSRTYPDRLFFLGGFDSLRGFLLDSLVPEDVAQKLLDPESGLTIRQVVIRGGDVYINPRTELRISFNSMFGTALFLDSGNLWTANHDFRASDLSNLRHTVGTGLRIATPIFPATLDVGFNVAQAQERLGLGHVRHPRDWEDLAAFHFNIGLF
jgi:outer membrane protein assembly factor BamA